LARVRTTFDAVAAFDVARHHLLGTSGTVTTLAGIALGLSRYERSKVDASWHDCDNILRIVGNLAALDLEGRAAIGCIGRKRADLIVPGSAIFAAIHAMWACKRLRVADRGLREGMLRALASAEA
jgi:exopolyphosphatase/guanosine-5'-triphosphate,3'-diphosphate pyrophosphatase